MNYSISTLKGIRDDFQHLRFNGTIYPFLTIRQGISGGIEYLEFLTSRSDILREKIGGDIERLGVLIAEVKNKLEPE